MSRQIKENKMILRNKSKGKNNVNIFIIFNFLKLLTIQDKFNFLENIKIL